MRSEYRLNKNLLTGLLIGLAVGVAVSWTIVPAYKSLIIALYKNEFAVLTFKCDQSMREHWISKMALGKYPTDDHVAELKAAELGLLDCQDYDLLQKKLLRLGLNESEIGELVLSAAELDPDSLRKVIGIHEIRY